LGGGRAPRDAVAFPEHCEESLDISEAMSAKQTLGTKGKGEGAAGSANGTGQWSIAELSRETGVTERNIRYYVSERLLPPAHGRGNSATYDTTHLLRLKLIQRMKKDHLTIAQMREELTDLNDRDMQLRLQLDELPTDNIWRRVILHPDLELHVRERSGKELDPEFQRAVDGIVHFAKSFLPREPSK
jgi:DNA-binding transcriptional MerR regulator